jgi:outer membrane murein-binding lipoprotein Lpp
MKTIMILFSCTLIFSAVVLAQVDVAITGTAKIPSYATKARVDSLSANIATLQTLITTLQAQLGAKADTSKLIQSNGLLKDHFILFDGVQAVNGPVFLGSSKDTIHIQTIQVWSK